MVVVTVWSAATLDIDTRGLSGAWANVGQFAQRALPPDASVLPQVAAAMVETVQMAVLGTLAAAVAAVPLAVASSRNVATGTLAAASRTLLAALRTLPAILWALILVAVTGLGVLAGVLALALYTTGYLGKLLYESIEDLPREPADAVTAIGATHTQVIAHVVLPEMAAALRAHVLFAFDYNVRHASILGVVGAGGVGTLMMGYLTFFQLDRLVTVLLVVFAVVLTIDAASYALRARYTELPAHVRAPRITDPATHAR